MCLSWERRNTNHLSMLLPNRYGTGSNMDASGRSAALRLDTRNQMPKEVAVFELPALMFLTNIYNPRLTIYPAPFSYPSIELLVFSYHLKPDTEITHKTTKPSMSSTMEFDSGAESLSSASPRSDERQNLSGSGYETATEDVVEDLELKLHLSYLTDESQGRDELHEVITTPIFTNSIQQYAQALCRDSQPPPFPQYALLAGNVEERATSTEERRQSDPRIFQNIAAPSSTFICGSQGSGKSHTLSCMLENCLIPSQLGKLPRPLTGVVFHYDTFVSDAEGTPCEAAYLASNSNVSVRVLCSSTNVATIKVGCLWISKIC